MANNTIKGKLCTISWHVDDNKASHVNPKVIDELLGDMKRYFGSLVVTIWGKHFFLGMNIQITDNKRI